jgi:hypothetical protein
MTVIVEMTISEQTLWGWETENSGWFYFSVTFVLSSNPISFHMDIDCPDKNDDDSDDASMHDEDSDTELPF